MESWAPCTDGRLWTHEAHGQTGLRRVWKTNGRNWLDAPRTARNCHKVPCMKQAWQRTASAFLGHPNQLSGFCTIYLQSTHRNADSIGWGLSVSAMNLGVFPKSTRFERRHKKGCNFRKVLSEGVDLKTLWHPRENELGTCCHQLGKGR